VRISDASWASLPYREINEIAQQDGSILLVPIGSIEQHGHHLPVATDTLLVDAVANATAERVCDSLPVLVTPPVWSGFSPHHMSFGGTITLDQESRLDALKDIADSALENEFDSILLLNGHGGNMSLVDLAASEIGNDHPDVEVLSLTYFQLAESFIDEIRDTEVGGMAHGGEFETSLMLYLHSDLVDEERLSGTLLDEPYDDGIQDLLEGGPLSVYRPFSEYSESGAIGDPTVASSVKGEQIFTRLQDKLEDLLREIHTNNSAEA
jgi:creatinine amidohydrolase